MRAIRRMIAGRMGRRRIDNLNSLAKAKQNLAHNEREVFKFRQ